MQELPKIFTKKNTINEMRKIIKILSDKGTGEVLSNVQREPSPMGDPLWVRVFLLFLIAVPGMTAKLQ